MDEKTNDKKESPKEGAESTKSSTDTGGTSSSPEPDSSTSEANSLEEEQSKASTGTQSEDGNQPQDNLLQKKWEEMFKRLVKYKEKNGNCLVPNRYPTDPQLGNWGKCF